MEKREGAKGGGGNRGRRRELSSALLSPHYFPSWRTPALNPWMNGPVLNKLSPDTQRKECAPQTTQQYCKAWISFPLLLSFPFPVFLFLPLDERQALPQTEISPVISTEAHSRWGRRQEREDRGIYVCLEKKYIPLFLHFVSSVFFVCVALQWIQGPPLDSIWRCLRRCFLFFTRQGPQHVQIKWFVFIWCLFSLLLCCLDCWGLAYQIKITTISGEGGRRGVCIGFLYQLSHGWEIIT